MINFRNVFYCCLMVMGTISTQAQDIHFTYFTFAPQSYNPALVGGYAGTFRAMGILRDQYSNGGEVAGYSTVEANVDAPIIKGFRDQDWIGVGIGFNKDAAGTARIVDQYSRVGAAYHLGLDKKANNYLSVGFQMTSLSRNLRTNGLVTAGQIVTGTPESIFNGTNSEPKASSRDWVLGLAYTTRTKTSEYKIGVSGAHILKNNRIGFERNFDQKPRIALSMQGKSQINPQFSVEPAVLVQALFEGNGFEFTAHNMFGYKLKKESPITMKGGIGFRTGTFSAEFLLGADYKGFFGGISYDMPVTGYAGATGIQNGFELGLGYLGVINKKPKTKPIILCPRL